VTEPIPPAGPGHAPGAHREAPPLADAVGALCPYLVTVGGRWRGLESSRDHRCAAVSPHGQIPGEKQRRSCLGAGHRTCPDYLAAERAAAPQRLASRRPLVATAPVVVERGGFPLPAGVRVERRLGARILAAIVVVAAVGAFLVARGPFAGPGASPAPSASAVAALPTVTPGATPTATPGVTPAPSATPAATPARTPKPSPQPVARTYRVRSGDTLSGIAAKFGTTSKILARLNGITNLSLLRVGQVLKLP